MKKLLLVGIPILAVLVALGVAYHFVVDTGTAARWYVQVDNAHVQPPGEDSDEYEYSLDAYDEDGNRHDGEFKATRQLRDDAYLELRTMPFRGVISWAEVQPEEMPEPAREALAA